MAAPPETSFSLLLQDSEPPFPDGLKDVLADLTFYCATFKMGIPFAPDCIGPPQSPLLATALRRACASRPLHSPKTAPWRTRTVRRVPANIWAGHLLHQQALLVRVASSVLRASHSGSGWQVTVGVLRATESLVDVTVLLNLNDS